MISNNLILKQDFRSFEKISKQKKICISSPAILSLPKNFNTITGKRDFMRGLSYYNVRSNPKNNDQITLPLTYLTLFTLKNAYFIVFPGLDGVIVTSEGYIVDEPSCFLMKQQLPPSENHSGFLFPDIEQKSSLDNVFVGFDAACFNYYHWLLYGISKTQLANSILPPDTILALPSEHSLFDNRQCAFSPTTYVQSLEYSGLINRATFMNYGIYPVKNLHFFWHNPLMPELYLTFDEIYTLFDTIQPPVNDSLPKRFYISREHHPNPRISFDEQRIIDKVLNEKSIEKVFLENMDFAAQVNLFRQADLIIAPHGAALANMVFAKKDTALLELNRKLDNQNHLRNCFYLLTAVKKQRYGCINLSDQPLTENDLSSAINQLIN